MKGACRRCLAALPGFREGGQAQFTPGTLSPGHRCDDQRHGTGQGSPSIGIARPRRAIAPGTFAHSAAIRSEACVRLAGARWGARGVCGTGCFQGRRRGPGTLRVWPSTAASESSRARKRMTACVATPPLRCRPAASALRCVPRCDDAAPATAPATLPASFPACKRPPRSHHHAAAHFATATAWCRAADVV